MFPSKNCLQHSHAVSLQVNRLSAKPSHGFQHISMPKEQLSFDHSKSKTKTDEQT